MAGKYILQCIPKHIEDSSRYIETVYKRSTRPGRYGRAYVCARFRVVPSNACACVPVRVRAYSRAPVCVRRASVCARLVRWMDIVEFSTRMDTGHAHTRHAGPVHAGCSRIYRMLSVFRLRKKKFSILIKNNVLNFINAIFCSKFSVIGAVFRFLGFLLFRLYSIYLGDK